MNNFLIILLKSLRKIVSFFLADSITNKLDLIDDSNEISKLIQHKLNSGKPLMISRVGLTELSAIINFLAVEEANKNYVSYVLGKQDNWWWDQNIIKQLQDWSGFFPSNEITARKFSKLYLSLISEIDLNVVFTNNSIYKLNDYFKKDVKNLCGVAFEPYGTNLPWTKVLKGKKVLVVHPFTNTIKNQYQKRKFLFKDPDFLPEFELKTIRAVQSLGGKSSKFTTWFDALEFMKNEINKQDYDICLLGCGAYGLPLAAHVKKNNKQAIHIGGSLQLIFGIKGKRWDNDNLYNQYWVRPSELEKPDVADNVEDSCYW